LFFYFFSGNRVGQHQTFEFLHPRISHNSLINGTAPQRIQYSWDKAENLMSPNTSRFGVMKEHLGKMKTYC
jgi:hypothetical protein